MELFTIVNLLAPPLFFPKTMVRLNCVKCRLFTCYLFVLKMMHKILISYLLCIIYMHNIYYKLLIIYMAG